MYKSFLQFLVYCYFVFAFLSCAGPINPGFRTFPMAPRMIQPVDNRSDKNLLPPDRNFVQSYTKYSKSKTNSNFGALVRLIEFEYDIGDTISIMPRLTSGYDEGEMTGWFTIMLDQYELTYESNPPQVRVYVEEISFEDSEPASDNQILYNPIGAIAANNTQQKQNKIVNRSQLYNSAKFVLEPEDARLIKRSKTLYYIIKLQNCTISIYPTKEQIGVLKRMIIKYYFS